MGFPGFRKIRGTDFLEPPVERDDAHGKHALTLGCQQLGECENVLRLMQVSRDAWNVLKRFPLNWPNQFVRHRQPGKVLQPVASTSL